ncbi:MAG: isoprenylcysteine carboxylmethyltransferase family protein [Actinomycetota bacterium]|nr:isoprenylcysteine carboxylmethyltransferase family protein [Actinomycetota bacterium]
MKKDRRLGSVAGEAHLNNTDRSTPNATGSRQRDHAVAWGFVAVQAALIIGILLTPTGDDWPLSATATAFATALTWLGLGLVIWAVLVFGRGVTPSPMPSNKAQLRTRGPYRWIRHPMYTGVIVLMAGSALGRRNWIAAALWVVLIVFFLAKMRWEERRLVETYPGYNSYREAVPALMPFGRRAEPLPDASSSR